MGNFKGAAQAPATARSASVDAALSRIFYEVFRQPPRDVSTLAPVGIYVPRAGEGFWLAGLSGALVIANSRYRSRLQPAGAAQAAPAVQQDDGASLRSGEELEGRCRSVEHVEM